VQVNEFSSNVELAVEPTMMGMMICAVLLQMRTCLRLLGCCW
jgi:hypothetical protein